MAKSKEKFDAEQFISSFKKKMFAPLYFFYGDETFLIEEVIDSLLEHAVDPAMKEFNLDIFYGNEIDGKKIVSLAAAYPMMAERRVVIIKDFDRVNDKDVLESYFQKPSASTILVLIANNPDFRKRPYSLIKKLGVSYEAASLRDYETIAWIDARIKKLKRSIEPPAVQLLYSYVGSSLRELTNEIEKLLLTIGAQAAITVKDVERVVGVSREFTSFELANKVAERNSSKAIEIADRLIGSGESIVGMIAVLTLHFIKLWKIQDGLRQRKSEQELAQIAGTHTFYLKSYLAQAKNYSPAEIENVFLILADADLAAKSSGDPKLIIARSITEIISGIVHKSDDVVAV
ncbi:MAG: DNA polymerase III subunit delta [Bacteroidota bacterium]|nr:DNA polymerase III subunit delta [Bacteroidota bacterium]